MNSFETKKYTCSLITCGTSTLTAFMFVTVYVNTSLPSEFTALNDDCDESMNDEVRL